MSSASCTLLLHMRVSFVERALSCRSLVSSQRHACIDVGTGFLKGFVRYFILLHRK